MNDCVVVLLGKRGGRAVLVFDRQRDAIETISAALRQEMACEVLMGRRYADGERPAEDDLPVQMQLF